MSFDESNVKRARIDVPDDHGETRCEERVQSEPGAHLNARAQESDLFTWQAKFAQCVTFKTFVENISNVLLEGHYTVIKQKDFEGIEIDSMDPTHVALVQGRLTASIEGRLDASNSSFCLKMSNVLSCLRNAHAPHFLDLSRPKDSTDVVLHVYEPEVNTYTPTFKLKTLAKESDSIQLRMMDYKILVEIDLQTFRNAIKTAKDHKADCVDLKVMTPKKRCSHRTTTFFVIKYASDEVSSIFPYQSVTEEEKNDRDKASDGTTEDKASEANSLCIKVSENIAGDYQSLPSEDELEVLYAAKFAVDYLFLMVKARAHGITHTCTLAHSFIGMHQKGNILKRYVCFYARIADVFCSAVQTEMTYNMQKCM